MGNNVSVSRNIADISVKSNDIQVLNKVSGGNSVFMNTIDGSNDIFIVFFGEISSHIDNLVRNVSLDESNKIRVKFSFSLNSSDEGFLLSDYIYSQRTSFGNGHITFISTDSTVSSIPLCVESLTIDPNNNNLARIIYTGYINKDISLDEGYDMDACVSFQITMPRIIT